jgi:hypothetical protein
MIEHPSILHSLFYTFDQRPLLSKVTLWNSRRRSIHTFEKLDISLVLSSMPLRFPDGKAWSNGGLFPFRARS